MEHHAVIVHHRINRITSHRKIVSNAVKKHFVKELLASLSYIYLIICYVAVFFTSIFLFLFVYFKGVAEVKEIFVTFFPKAIIFLVATYCTLLPWYLVIPIVVFVEDKRAYAVLGVSLIFSLIYMFLV